MSTELDVRPDLDATDGDDDVQHIVCCCSTNIALCGKNVLEDTLVQDDDWDESLGCKRCLELETVPCILCGYDNTGCFCGKCA
jgi:hypothetical protein